MRIAAVAAAACGETPAPDAASPGGEIDWHEGDLSSAFARAAREGKPVFVYWGAAWCPPCQYLEHTVFRRPEFLARSRAFVNAYVDGDAEGAQRLGEELGVHGYPTVVLFDAAGREVTRIPNLPIAEFVRVLDQTVARMRPIRSILSDALSAEPGVVTAEDLRALAFYAWSEDARVFASEEEAAEAFRRLFLLTPVELAEERSRFLLEYVRRRARQPGSRFESERADLARELLGLLSDPSRVRANLAALTDTASLTVLALHPEPSAARDTLVTAWEAAMRAASRDTTLPWEDRLDALLPLIELHRVRVGGGVGRPPAPLPDSLVAEISALVRAATAGVDESAERHSVWNRLNALARRSGLAAVAESLLVATLDETVAPFYHMWLLAGHARRDGRTEEAIEWRRRAWEASRGAATRFEAGRYYVEELIALAPDDARRIGTESRRLLGELLAHADAFANRNLEGLRRLSAAWSGWAAAGGAERRDALAGIRAAVAEACPRFPGTAPGSPGARCRDVAAELGSPRGAAAPPRGPDGDAEANRNGAAKGAEEADRIYR